MKKTLALVLLVASSVQAVELAKYLPVAGVLVAGEVLHQYTSKDKRSALCDSCPVNQEVTDVATATVGAAAMMVVKRKPVTPVEVAVEGVTSYLALKMSNSCSFVKDLCAKVPGVRGIMVDSKDDSAMSPANLTRYAVCYLVCTAAVEAARSFVTQTLK